MRKVESRFWRTNALAIATLLLCEPALAYKIYTVDSVADLPDDDIGDFICHTQANTCTLRAAVMQASYNSVGVTDGFVIIVPPGFYFLAPPYSAGGGKLDLKTPPIGSPFIQIQGDDAATTIIDAGGADRVFHIGASREAIFISITIQHGYADIGAGIGNEGRLDLYNVVVDHNVAQTDGGGVYNYGNLYISGSTISNNIAAQNGGGIYNSHTPDNSTNMIVDGSAIIGNSSNVGGGIGNETAMTILNTTIAANQAKSDGGGIFEGSLQVSTNIYNATIAYNGSDSDRDFVGSGGGIFSNAGAEPANLYNTIVAGNTTSNTPIPDDCFGAVATHARNRFGTTDGCAITQISGSYALLSGGSLGGLQDNGGPTLTIALQAGSNAIDATDPNAGCRDQYSLAIPNDQRGFRRNVGLCDIGAYEFGALADGDLIFRNGFDPAS